LNIWFGLVVAVIATAIVAWLINLLILRPFTDRGTSPIMMLVVTLGLSLILQNIILAIFSE
jgi:branched-subunit amino acid ABC-type transport system permease component